MSWSSYSRNSSLCGRYAQHGSDSGEVLTQAQEGYKMVLVQAGRLMRRGGVRYSVGRRVYACTIALLCYGSEGSSRWMVKPLTAAPA